MRRQHYFLLIGAAFGLAACAAIPSAATGVSVSGVNYTADEMTYVAKDPAKPANGAGEVIGAYSAGGVMCCYDLPATWHPGIKVNVKFYDIKGEVKREVTTDVLPYVDGKPGQLWIASYPDGSVEAVSSEYVPSHAKWPGKIKGWPVPSLEFRRQLWQEKIDSLKVEVSSLEKLHEELRTDPNKHVEVFWKLDSEYGKRGELAKFTGPYDPAYILHMKKMNETGLASIRQDLKEAEESKP